MLNQTVGPPRPRPIAIGTVAEWCGCCPCCLWPDSSSTACFHFQVRTWAPPTAHRRTTALARRDVGAPVTTTTREASSLAGVTSIVGPGVLILTFLWHRDLAGHVVAHPSAVIQTYFS